DTMEDTSTVHGKLSDKSTRKLICKIKNFLHTLCIFGTLKRDQLCEAQNLTEIECDVILKHYESCGSSTAQFINCLLQSGFFDPLENLSERLIPSIIDKNQLNENARKYAKIVYLDPIANTETQNACPGSYYENYEYIDVNRPDVYGLTALEYALIYERSDLVRILLQVPQLDPNTTLHFTIAGLSADVLTNFQTRPLADMVAKRSISLQSTVRKEQLLNGLVCRKSKDFVETLLKHPNLDVNALDCDGHSALYEASQNGLFGIAKLLMEHKDIDINQHCIDGNTALHAAIQNGCHKMANVLLDNSNIKVNACNGNGETALMLSANEPHLIEKMLTSFDDIDVNAVDNNDQYSTLHRAVLAKNKESCQLLCKDERINSLVKDKHDLTPLGLLKHQNSSSEYPEILKVLQIKERKCREDETLKIKTALEHLSDVIRQSYLISNVKTFMQADIEKIKFKLSRSTKTEE
ncbi:unnamed protein product, partial [Owenia fusiformis]